MRLYVGLRAGVAIPTNADIAPGIEAKPVPASIGGALDQYYSLALGTDLGPHVGVELPVEGTWVVMALHNLGSIGEYAFYSFAPQLRLRYPLEGGRVVPYAMAGVGLGHTEFKETKPRGFDLDVHAIDYSVATAAGVGVEYFITSNVAFGVESKYLYSPGHVIKINGHAETGTLQFASISMGFRVYFAAFGR